MNVIEAAQQLLVTANINLSRQIGLCVLRRKCTYVNTGGRSRLLLESVWFIVYSYKTTSFKAPLLYD